MMKTLCAAGDFEINMTTTAATDPRISYYSLLKKYSGDLIGHSQGHMIAVQTASPGNAGYVAIEYFDGSLLGRQGSFALQHNGLLTAGIPTLDVIVVPGSATGKLVGLSGQMSIFRTETGHRYSIEAELP